MWKSKQTGKVTQPTDIGILHVAAVIAMPFKLCCTVCVPICMCEYTHVSKHMPTHMGGVHVVASQSSLALLFFCRAQR